MTAGKKNPRTKKYVVYKATCRVNGKAYVGKTIYTTRYRWNTHISTAHNIKYPLARAIVKYGSAAFDVITLYEGVDNREIFAVEKAMIATHRTFAPHGYNITSGGDGVSGHKWSEETRAKLKAARGWIKAAEKRRGVPLKPEHKAALVGHLKSIKERISKPVICIETGETWPDMKSCARGFGVKGHTQLRRAINSPFRKFHGLTFKDIEGSHIPEPSEGSRHRHPIKCVETGRIWISQTACTMELSGNKNTMCLYKCLDKPNRTYRGFHFISIKVYGVKDAA